MFEKTRKKLEDAFGYAKKLIEAESHDPKNIEPNAIPKEVGIYLWRSRDNNEIVYVGSARGKSGLYQRIITHGHLNPSYREKNKEKSVFRKAVAEEQHLETGNETIDFIKNKFTLSFIMIPKEDEDIILLAEALLQIEYSPKYNKQNKIF